MKQANLFFLTLAIIIIATNVVLAQPGLPNAPSQAPIDGGLSLLAAAGGVVYAMKKLRSKTNAE